MTSCTRNRPVTRNTTSNDRIAIENRAVRAFTFGLLTAVTLVLGTACGVSKAAYTSRAMPAPSAAPVPATPKVLERSVFARDPQGQLTEERLQEILSSELELDLPARVGILPIVDAKDWRGPGPLYDSAPAAMAELVRGLRGSEPFTLVSEMMPIPSGALGMEALREMAARYKLRYIILYRERVGTKKRANPWVAGYITGIGALFLPGDTLHVGGFVEATLFDVKTGILNFTVRRRVTGKRVTNSWHTSDKLAQMRVDAVANAAPDLAKDIRKAVYRYTDAVRVENQRRRGEVPSKAMTASSADRDRGEATAVASKPASL